MVDPNIADEDVAERDDTDLPTDDQEFAAPPDPESRETPDVPS